MSEQSLVQTDRTDLSTKNGSERQQFWRPWYHVESSAEAHTLQVAMPGVAKAGVDVSLDGDQLTITGHRKDAVPETWKRLNSEMGHRDYRLTLRLNVEVDEDKISASVEDGMLTLTMPVREEAKPRRIAVQ